MVETGHTAGGTGHLGEDGLRTILASLSDGVLVCEPDGEIVAANPAAAELFDRTPAALRASNVRDLAADGGARTRPGTETLLDRLRAVARDDTVCEWVAPGPDGPAPVCAEVVRREVEASERLVATVWRPDEHGRELEEVTTRLELALEGTDTGVWEWDLETDEVIWDETSERLFGYDDGEFPGAYRGFVDRVSDDDIGDVERAVRQSMETGETYEAEFRVEHPDGETRWLQARGVVTDEGDPEADPLASGRMIGVQTDVTDRKRSERDLERLTTRLELALEGTDTGVWEWNVDTGEVIWDETSERLFGYDDGEFPGTYEEFEERVHPDDLAAVERAVDEALHRDEPFSVEFRVERPDGETRWLQARGARVDGEVLDRHGQEDDCWMTGVQTGVTERKRSERDLEAHNERLELLNRIVRHDIRNDMEVVLSCARLVEETVEDDRALERVSQLEETADHVVELTEVVREIIESDEDDGVEPVHLGRTLADELSQLRGREGVTVGWPDPQPDVRVLADESLGTVFRNLLSNAVRHNDTDEPTVEVSVVERERHVVVRVADDGPGIPPERREEVFARGEKGLESPGSGLGLYLVDNLVDGYGGEAWVEENDPRGAVFAVELRRADAG